MPVREPDRPPPDATAFAGPDLLARPRILRLVESSGPDLPSSTRLLLDAADQMAALAADARAEAERATEAEAHFLVVADRLRALAAADAALPD